MHGFLWNKEIKERRGSYRQPVEARVDISHSTFGTLHGLTRDISDTGMFITLKQVPRLPKGAHLRVVLPDSANPNIIFNMRVARSNDDGIGLVFVDYEQDGTRYDMETLLSELRKKAARSTSQKG